MKRIIGGLLGMVFVTIVCLGFAGPAAPASVEDFYKKKTLTFIVTYAPGGGTDAAARVMSLQWPKVTGGKMVIRNMTGAGGMRAMNHIYKLKPDGLTLGYTDTSSTGLGPVLFKAPGIGYDITKFTYIAANVIMPNGIGLSPRLAAESIEDLQKMEGVKFGAHGIDIQAACAAVTIHLFGLKNARIVTGYGGMEETGLDLARGEIDAYSNSMQSITDHIKKKYVKKVILVYSRTRSPWFPDVPVPTERVKLTPEKESLYTVVVSAGSGKPIFAPPGLSKEKTEYLRGVFQKIFQMEDYRNRMKVRFPIMGPEFHATGEEYLKITKDALAMPEAERDKVIDLVKHYAK